MSEREIKAMDTPPNARVEVMTERRGVTRIIRGLVNSAETTGDSTWITFADNRSEEMRYDHPVTVLDEPEPEWVEGAWYWASARGATRLVRRVQGGWSGQASGYARVWLDDSDHPTILGRVLIVDWPGDEHASKLVETYGAGLTWDDFECSPLQKVADAIRTQGGVR